MIYLQYIINVIPPLTNWGVNCDRVIYLYVSVEDKAHYLKMLDCSSVHTYIIFSITLVLSITSEGIILVGTLHMARS
jgi:hypothetical protein